MSRAGTLRARFVFGRARLDARRRDNDPGIRYYEGSLINGAAPWRLRSFITRERERDVQNNTHPKYSTSSGLPHIVRAVKIAFSRVRIEQIISFYF